MLASDSHSNPLKEEEGDWDRMAMCVTVPLEALAQIEVIKLKGCPRSESLLCFEVVQSGSKL